MPTPNFNNGGADTSVTPETTRVHGFTLPPEGRVYRPTYSRGQYVLPPLEVGAANTKLTRATTVAHALDDQAGLDKWKTRQVVRGMVDLYREDADSLEETLSQVDLFGEPRDLNRDLDAVVQSAQDRAGSSYGSELGTTIHAWTEAVERDGLAVEDVPNQFRPYVQAYMDRLADAGISTEPGMVERIVVNDQYNSAGTFDRLYRLPDGSLAIGDVKTSKMSSLNYSWLGWSTQMALYAGAARMLTLDGTGYEDMPVVRQDYAVVAHLPSDNPGHCELITVDLQAGRQALETAMDVRFLRQNAGKVIPRQWTLPSHETTLEDLVAQCSTQDELAELWDANQDQWTDELTQLGLSRLHP